MSDSQMQIATICFGFTLGFTVLTGSKVGQQTISIFKRTGTLWSLYLTMIWMELAVCFAWALSAWLFLRGDIGSSFGFYFYIATLWTLQTQCLIQITANRVALIMPSRHHARTLKLSLLLAVGLVNVSVYIIWIPARMEVAPVWMRINYVWDRIEKVIYLVLDLGLNGYFLWLMRSRLIARGLDKYAPLFRFNASVVGVSIAMDALIIGMMNLPNDMVYTQFHSLAYIVKLNIELCMADLIAKLVRRPDGRTADGSPDSTAFPHSKNATHVSASLGQRQKPRPRPRSRPRSRSRFVEEEEEEDEDVASETSSNLGIDFVVPENGIMKTVAVETTVSNEGKRGGAREGKYEFDGAVEGACP